MECPRCGGEMLRVDEVEIEDFDDLDQLDEVASCVCPDCGYREDDDEGLQ